MGPGSRAAARAHAVSDSSEGGPPGGRECRLSHPALGEVLLQPGRALRLGRHEDNDLVLPGAEISRFHARVAWPRRASAPVVHDGGSQNGTRVDGQLVGLRGLPLADGARLELGPYALDVALRGEPPPAGPAVLADAPDEVSLFWEDGPQLSGEVGPELPLLDLLGRLERDRRTGTLRLALTHGAAATLTYCLGRIMRVVHPDGLDLRGLERVLRLERAPFCFSRELEPFEDPLDLWLSDFLRTRQLGSGRRTRRRPR